MLSTFESILKYAVFASALFSFCFLLVLIKNTFAWGNRRIRSVPRRAWSRGVIFAFGKGMMPWEKESASRHLVTYFSGFGYHFGIFSGVFFLAAQIVPFYLGSAVLFWLRIFMGVGFLCGSGLLIKRIIKPHMRRISCPDDYLSNLLVDLFILSALSTSYVSEIKPVFYLSSIFMLLYLPLGKIRHCFYFFYSRILFGRFFGRRGIFPQASHEIKKV